MTRTTSPVVFGAAVGAQWELPGFSRMPLSVRVFSKEASAREIAHFVSKAARRHGRPAHFISDHARRFTGQIFRRKLKRLGVKQRFGAVGKKGSIALIERLWRTLKDTLRVEYLDAERLLPVLVQRAA